MKHTFPFGEWLSKIGNKAPHLPEFTPLVQPVQIVGDASALVPPLLAPIALYGGNIAAGGAGALAGFQVQATAKGGAYLRRLSVHVVNVAQYFSITVEAANPLAADPLVGVAAAHNMAPDAMRSVVRDGTSTASLSVDSPQLYVFATGTVFLEDPAIIPPGSWFSIQTQSPNQALWWSAIVQDVPVIAGERA